MKAPNVKATNLNEAQWIDVRTKRFKDWFGDWENDAKNASKVAYRDWETDRKSTRLNSSHSAKSRMPSSA